VNCTCFFLRFLSDGSNNGSDILAEGKMICDSAQQNRPQLCTSTSQIGTFQLIPWTQGWKITRYIRKAERLYFMPTIRNSNSTMWLTIKDLFRFSFGATLVPRVSLEVAFGMTTRRSQFAKQLFFNDTASAKEIVILCILRSEQTLGAVPLSLDLLKLD
jgi:hypothetical protein